MAATLVGLTEVRLATGAPELARAAVAELVELADTEDYQLLAVDGPTLLAQVAVAEGDLAGARGHAERALRTAREAGYRLAEAKALEVLARADPSDRAEHLLADALALYAEIGSPAAARVRDALAELHAG